MSPAVDFISEASSAFNNKFGNLPKDANNSMRKDKTIGLQAAATNRILEKHIQVNFAAEISRRLLLWRSASERPLRRRAARNHVS